MVKESKIPELGKMSELEKEDRSSPIYRLKERARDLYGDWSIGQFAWELGSERARKTGKTILISSTELDEYKDEFYVHYQLPDGSWFCGKMTGEEIKKNMHLTKEQKDIIFKPYSFHRSE